MDLLQNPFYVLKASPYDNRRRIYDLADEASLVLDSSECMEARSALTNPRKRLSAEIAWLPGLEKSRSDELLSCLDSDPVVLLRESNLPALARANLLASGIVRLGTYSIQGVSEWSRKIAGAFEDVDAGELRDLINSERSESGFPEVTDLAAVEDEIRERQRHFIHAIKSALNNLSARDLVQCLTMIVASETDNGLHPGPVLIDDLVDAYEVEAQDFFGKEEKNIQELIENLKRSVDAGQPDCDLEPQISRLSQVVKNWDFVAQPIQLSTKSRGMSHEGSRRVANKVRDLSVGMYNEHHKLAFAKQLTLMMQEVFAEVEDIAEQAANDADSLEKIEKNEKTAAEENKKKQAAFRREITYEAEIGLVFKDKLRISPEGIEWDGKCWKLESITRVRWGGTSRSINGIPQGTEYTIYIGTDSVGTTITTKRFEIYSQFISRLWKAVGVRIVQEYLEGLAKGKTYKFGVDLVLKLKGLELVKRRWFSDDERIFCKWNEVETRTENGSFIVAQKGNTSLYKSLSYQNEDNTHILEALIFFLKKQ